MYGHCEGFHSLIRESHLSEELEVLKQKRSLVVKAAMETQQALEKTGKVVFDRNTEGIHFDVSDKMDAGKFDVGLIYPDRLRRRSNRRHNFSNN